jgi:hypothetical protein
LKAGACHAAVLFARLAALRLAGHLRRLDSSYHKTPNRKTDFCLMPKKYYSTFIGKCTFQFDFCARFKKAAPFAFLT